MGILRRQSRRTAFATQCTEILNEIAPMFESGTLQPPAIGERYTLADAAHAFGRVAAGQRGKIVFLMSSDGTAPGDLVTSVRSDRI
jgi:NADPH:quinone reductase-like Zn-dependent oxidoreductase